MVNIDNSKKDSEELKTGPVPAGSAIEKFAKLMATVIIESWIARSTEKMQVPNKVDETS